MATETPYALGVGYRCHLVFDPDRFFGTDVFAITTGGTFVRNNRTFFERFFAG
jgi:hypothetical protein